MLRGPDASASVILLRSQNQNRRGLFCNIEAVIQSSNLIVGSQTDEKLSRLTADAVVTHLVQKLNRDESRRAHARIPGGGDVPVVLLAPIFVDLSDRLVYNPKFVVVRRKGVPP
jgi:hypothetical protein